MTTRVHFDAQHEGEAAGMQGALERLEAVYAEAAIPERFRGVFYDEPHSFRPPMQEDAFAFFQRWL